MLIGRTDLLEASDQRSSLRSVALHLDQCDCARGSSQDDSTNRRDCYGLHRASAGNWMVMTGAQNDRVPASQKNRRYHRHD